MQGLSEREGIRVERPKYTKQLERVHEHSFDNLRADREKSLEYHVRTGSRYSKMC